MRSRASVYISAINLLLQEQSRTPHENTSTRSPNEVSSLHCALLRFRKRLHQLEMTSTSHLMHIRS